MRFSDEREVKVILNIDFFLTCWRLQSLFLFISLFSLEFWVFEGFQESEIRAGESAWEQSLNLDNLNVGHIKKIHGLSSLLINFSDNFILSKGSIITQKIHQCSKRSGSVLCKMERKMFIIQCLQILYENLELWRILFQF